VYYVSSYFWDRALDSGIIADTKALSWKTTPGVRDGSCVGQWYRALRRAGVGEGLFRLQCVVVSFLVYIGVEDRGVSSRCVRSTAAGLQGSLRQPCTCHLEAC
jgi:hypothetical protein